jgi:hypothetical protein
MVRLFVRLAVCSLRTARRFAQAKDAAALGSTIAIHARLLTRLL